MSNQNVETPLDFLRAVEDRFGAIGFDLAANEENNAVMRLGHVDGQRARSYYLGPGSLLAENAFLRPWHGLGELAWLNPPFADISPWAMRCALSRHEFKQRIALLIPASVCTSYFISHVAPHAYVFELTPRPFKAEVRDCVLALYEPALYRGRETWKWR